MEVKLDKRYPVAAGVEHAWAVLSDVRATAACMPGAQITGQLDAQRYKGTVRSKVGPATMTFQGEIEVLGLDVEARRLQMVGKGADKSGSSASMNLTAHVEAGPDGEAVLVGQAVIVVAGKLAQFGSRLLVPVSDAMLSQFADNFRAAAAAADAAAAASGESAPAPSTPGAEPSAVAEPAPTSEPAAAAPVAVADDAPRAASTSGAMGGTPAPSSPPARPPARPHSELNVFSLLWQVVKGWFSGLLGRGR